MIHFFTRYYKGTINGFIDSWANELRPHVQVVRYREIPFLKLETGGPCVFADLERARRWELHFARKLCRRLQAASGKFPILNHPDRYPGRFRLLRKLREQGVNDFQAYRLDELKAAALKFPVFLRRDLDHRGALGGLLWSRNELDRALTKLSLRDRLRKKRLMVVEYCDCTGADGIFRKYSALYLHGAVIPSHLYFSTNWVTKAPELATASLAAEESEFVDAFPHADRVANVFQLAGVDYGRLDYGLKQGRLQAWEINTNPIIVRRREVIHPLRLPSQAKSARLVAAAFAALPRRAAARGPARNAADRC